MDQQPKKLITRILEFSTLFALAAFLIKLAACYLLEVWWVLLIIAVVVICGIIAYRIWRNHVKW